MRITRIDIQGGNPQHFARIERRAFEDRVEIEILKPTGSTKHSLDARKPDDLWALACTIQHALDGQRGCGGDIREYRDLLEQIAL